MIKTPLINTIENYTPILQDCGVQVNTDRGVIDCIWCKSRETMYYANSGAVSSSNSPWFSCSACKWSGDAINAWAVVKDLELEEAIDRLKKNKTFYVKGMEFEILKDEYLDKEINRQAINDAWESTSSLPAMENISRRELGLLEEYNIARHIGKDWNTSLGQYVGYSRADAIKELFSTRQEPTGREHRPFILSPIMDLPGRITRMVALQKHRGHKCYEILDIDGQPQDGLFGMSAIDLFEENIYTCADLPLVLSLQASARHMSNLPIPLVGHTSETERVWNLFPHSKIIFYTPIITADVFKAALKIYRNAYITTGPRISIHDDPERVLIERNGTELLDTFYSTKIPVFECLRDYILNLRTTKIRSFLDTIDMTERHWTAMMTTVEKDSPEYHRLNSIRSSGAVSKRIPFIGHRRGYLECVDGKISLNGESVCGAVPTIDKVIKFRNRVLIEGKVHVDEETYPFSIPFEEFGYKWVENFCRKKGHLITVTTALRKNFEHYINEFSNPIREEGIDVLGWDEEAGSFVFPKKCINFAGRLEDVKAMVLGEHVTSGIDFDYGIPENFADLVKPDKSNTIYLASLCCSLASIISYAEDTELLQVNIKGKDQDRNNLFTRITNEFKFDSGEPSESDINYPSCYAMESGENSSKYIQELELDRGRVMTLDEGLTRLTNLSGGFLSLSATDYRGVTSPENSFLWIEALKQYLAAGRNLSYIKHYESKTNHLVHAVIKLVIGTLAKYVSVGTQRLNNTITEISNIIHVDVKDGNDSGKRLIYALLYLVENQAVSISEDAKSDILLGNTVHINYKNVKKHIRGAKHISDAGVITKSFEDKGCLINKKFGLHDLEGWEISREYWDKITKEWHGLTDC